MAEDTAVAEPPAQAAPAEEISPTLKSFGDLSEIFDKAFPTTAEKKDEKPPAPPPTPPPAEPAKPPEKTPEPAPAAKASTDDLPSFLTGRKEEPPPPAEPEVPAPAKGEPVGMTNLRNAYNTLKENSRLT